MLFRSTVRRDGSVADVQVVRPLDPAYDAEAVRVVEAMPRWNPGVQRGEAVDCKCTLPISFKVKE